MEEIYPMPAFAQLQVANLDYATRWYTSILKFRTIFSMPGQDGNPIMVHLRRSRYQDLLLIRAQKPRESSIVAGVTLYFQFEDDWDALAALAERARQTETSLVEGPLDTPWNTREVRLYDLDGYHLVFTKGPVIEKTSMQDIVTRSQTPR